jgi:hypothetical protein
MSAWQNSADHHALDSQLVKLAEQIISGADAAIVRESTSSIIEGLTQTGAGDVDYPKRFIWRGWEARYRQQGDFAWAWTTSLGLTEDERDALAAVVKGMMGVTTMAHQYHRRAAELQTALAEYLNLRGLGHWKSTKTATMPASTQPANDPTAYRPAKEFYGDAPQPTRKGRLPRRDSEAKRATMLAVIRQHPTLKDEPGTLATHVGVSESTVRRWLDDEDQKYRESKAANPEPPEE